MICGSIPSGPTTYPAPAEGDDLCCYGAAFDGPEGCTCWRPVYDEDQTDENVRLGVQARRSPCHDCAYRSGSPELEAGEHLPGLGAPFWCHQGMRKVVRWEHPDGRTAPASPGTYMPVESTDVAVPLKTDGSPADLCAGWLRQHAEKVPTTGLHYEETL